MLPEKRLPTILPDPAGAFRLRLAGPEDQDRLRSWKNANREFFFHKEEISRESQFRWFEAYLKRADDHVYVVDENDGRHTPIGIVACRLLVDESTVDIYNVMRGHRTATNRAKMGEALTLLCHSAKEIYDVPITCKVITNNPALNWYKGLGFEVREDRGEYQLLGFQRGSEP